MKTFLSHSVFAASALLFICTLARPAQAQAIPGNGPTANEQTAGRLEIEFTQAPLLELELTKYLSSDVHKPRTFELTATVVEPLRTESGLIIIPAQTRLRLKAAVRPGTYFAHPGEAVLWLDPFPVGKGVEGFACDAEPSAFSTTSSGASLSGPTQGRLLPQLCQQTWRLAFDHVLDYAATPETARPLVLERKPHHEGLNGTRASHPPNVFYDPTSTNADQRLQAAANHLRAAGIVYELSAAVVGAVRFLFSKRNVFLPTGTRIVFQLEQKVRLVPATDPPPRFLPFNAETRKHAGKPDQSENETRKQ